MNKKHLLYLVQILALNQLSDLEHITLRVLVSLSIKHKTQFILHLVVTRVKGDDICESLEYNPRDVSTLTTLLGDRKFGLPQLLSSQATLEGLRREISPFLSSWVFLPGRYTNQQVRQNFMDYNLMINCGH